MTEEGMNQRVDAEGVLNVIQSITYNYSVMSFDVRFFNGRVREFSADDWVCSVGLMDHHPSRMQMLEAEGNIERFALKNWQRLFAHVSLV